ncbi:MAG: lipoyl(octanoyl) transferase LipB [Deltaproteobacteria bacterium]|nr:lipoyl(octanoyl) transferase LipB [Deltaproteobacteria bacterium]
MTNLSGKRWRCTELPLTEYKDGLHFQKALARARGAGIIDSDIVLMLEHPSVFTLGRSGGIENLKVPRDFLDKENISLVQSDRGGNITYHGPGQLVVYPIIHLREAGLEVLTLVDGLEEVLIRVAADWGIPAKRNPLNRGIWVGNRKLASVGMSVKKDVCFHGFALNVNLSLAPFTWIHPCGLHDIGVTSMRRELSQEIPMDRLRDAVRDHMASFFGVSFVLTSPSELQNLLP